MVSPHKKLTADSLTFIDYLIYNIYRLKGSKIILLAWQKPIILCKI